VRLWNSVQEIWPDGLVEVIKYLDVPDINDRKNAASVWEALLNEASDPSSTGEGAMEVDQSGDVDDEGKEEDESSDKEDEAPEFDPRCALSMRNILKDMS